MKTSTTLWVAITMLTVSLAGCTGGGELDMLVTPSDDAVTLPFLFEATGPSYDHYEWDFSDGTPAQEGEEVEHLFGFTNGDIVVRLTATNEGDEANAVTIARTVPLGGSRNVNPVGNMISSSFWINPGDVFTVSSAGTTDADNDPLMYRWTVARAGDLQIVDTSHPPHEGFGGVPFGVDAWGALEPNLTGGTDYGGDLAASLSASEIRPWSFEDDAITGSLTESGVYIIEVFVRDPKGTPWVGRINLWVADEARPKPAETYTVTTSGTFNAGGGGSFQAFYDDGLVVPVVEQEVPPLSTVGGDDQTFDRIRVTFPVDINSLSGDIKFSYSGGSAETDSTSAQYDLYPEGSDTSEFGTKSGDYSFGQPGGLRSNPNGSPRDYLLEVTLTPAGSQVAIEFEMTVTNDLDPLNWYELP